MESIDYRQLIEKQQVLAGEKSQFGRIKPWESYRFQQQDNAGLLGLLSQQEIDSVQVVYFTQEDYRDDTKSETAEGDIISAKQTKREQDQQMNDKVSSATSHYEQKFLQALKRSQANLKNVDTHSMMSKTSI